MKVAWFTPFNIESAIGRYSKFAVEALSKYVDVDIFSFQNSNLHDTNQKIVYYDQKSVCEKLENYDIAVYNIGDCAEYHSDIYEVLQKHPGVVIDHDICLFNFMWGYWINYRSDPAGLVKLLEKTYGKDDAERIWKLSNIPGGLSTLDLRTYSLAESIGNNALGIIVHSNYHKSYVEKFYKGDIGVVAHLDTNDELSELDYSINFTGYSGNKIHILTVGNVNENKRIHSLIQVLGENENLAKYFDYTIVGSKSNIHYCKYLQRIIKQYRLENQVKLVGFVSHKELAHYYHKADLISNLRFPAYEGASGSIVEQMSIGKACIVSDTGVYSELNDDSVLKISPEKEEQDLKRVLNMILLDRSIIEKTSENAKAYAEKYLDRDLYARKVYAFLKQITFEKPVYELADHCVNILADMPSILDLQVFEKITGEIRELYGA